MTVASQHEGSGPLPAPNLGNLVKLSSEDVVGACLASFDAPDRREKLIRRLRKMLAVREIQAALATLEGKGLLKQSTAHPVLTPDGQRHFRKLFGIDKPQPWDAIVNGRLVAMALGFRPREKSGWTVNPQSLAALVVATCFGLSRKPMSVAGVASELIWKVLRVRVPELVAPVPLPIEIRLDHHSRAVLLGLAGLKSGNVKQAMAVLAARCVGLGKADAKELSMALVRQAIRLEPKAPALSGFAKNVLDVAAGLKTPPFDGRVAIAQVYDAYGKQYDDAGTLADFKRRLVAVATKHELSLQRLDMPDLMSRDLRERSQMSWGNDVVHFVVVEWL
jgi:hypothetical protein